MPQIKLIKDFPFRQTFKINPAIGLSGCLKLNTTYSLEDFQQMTGLQNPLSVIKEFPEYFEIQKPTITYKIGDAVIHRASSTLDRIQFVIKTTTDELLYFTVAGKLVSKNQIYKA